jgi:hypothetical protein
MQSASTGNLALKRASHDSDITAFFQLLFKCIDRLDKDINEHRHTMTEEKSELLARKMEELKKFLEIGYQTNTPHPIEPKTHWNWWSKMIKIFRK